MSVTINGSSGLVFADNTAQTTAATCGLVNKIINGRMEIDQRNAGASITANDGAFGVDRFQYHATQSSKGTLQQNAGSVTLLAGFNKYLGFTSSSAYSITSSDQFNIWQKIEGNNIADLAWGTANASAVTLSFKVYSSLTGTFGGAIFNRTGARSYPFTYTISSANTWTTISVTIAGDTSGTWDTDNSIGMYVIWGLGVGSTYSGTAGSWSGNLYYSATGATSVVGTNGATFYITGVDLRKGSVGATSQTMDVRPYGTELALCQRYYEVCSGGWYGSTSGTSQRVDGSFIVSKRAAPTLTRLTSSENFVTAVNVGAGNDSSINWRISGTVAATGNDKFMYATLSAAAEL